MKGTFANILSGLSLLALVASPTKVSGSNFNYTNFEIGSTYDLDILYAAGSIAIMESAHLNASLSSAFENDWVATVGAGFHAPLNGRTDLYGNLVIYNINTKEPDNDWYGDFGFGGNVGLRFWVNPAFEGNASVGKISINGGSNNSLIIIGARFHSKNNLSIGVNYNTTGIYKQEFFINVRFEY